MVPNGWKEGRVRDLIKSLDAGVSVNSEDDGNIHAAHKILKTSCVSKGIFKSTETKSVIEDIEISRLKQPVLPDSIIISRMNTPELVGANGYVANGIKNTYLPDRLWQAKPISAEVNMRWLGYWFASSYTRYTLGSTATGTSGSMKNITKSDVLNIKIDIPPLPEQRKIAAILSTWDKAISTTERLIDNSKQQKKALMQQLLTGKKRLLDENGERFRGEWTRFLLGEVFSKVSNGVTYDSNNTEGLPVTRIETISTGKVNYKKVGWAPDNENTKRFRLSCGDILYSHINSLEHIGRVAYFNDLRPIYHGMNLLLLRTHEKHHDLFLFHLLNSPIGKKLSKTYAKSAVNQASISTTDIKAFKVYLPNLKEQQKIAAVLTTADQEIEVLQGKLEALKQEKKALMQQLLTGKRRVKVDDKEVA